MPVPAAREGQGREDGAFARRGLGRGACGQDLARGHVAARGEQARLGRLGVQGLERYSAPLAVRAGGAEAPRVPGQRAGALAPPRQFDAIPGEGQPAKPAQRTGREEPRRDPPFHEGPLGVRRVVHVHLRAQREFVVPEEPVKEGQPGAGFRVTGERPRPPVHSAEPAPAGLEDEGEDPAQVPGKRKGSSAARAQTRRERP
ncbi:MAG: hypothetical protein M5U26_20040 [Planctomycetota bacterium]|nr:hypothetical protein [Planctomycetota bacterium]